MPFSQEQIRDILVAKEYEKYAVEDLLSYPDCLAENNEGADAFDRFKAWKDGAHKASPASIPENPTTNTFLYHAQQMRKPTAVKSAECGKFAGLAVGDLLQTYPGITKDYNVVMAGIMGNKHNIAILIPNDPKAINLDAEKNAAKIKEGFLPRGSLIVDPWARALGHPVETTLAVPAENYHFEMSLPGMRINYQSNKDPTATMENSASAAATVAPESQLSRAEQRRLLAHQELLEKSLRASSASADSRPPARRDGVRAHSAPLESSAAAHEPVISAVPVRSPSAVLAARRARVQEEPQVVAPPPNSRARSAQVESNPEPVAAVDERRRPSSAPPNSVRSNLPSIEYSRAAVAALRAQGAAQSGPKPEKPEEREEQSSRFRRT